MIESTDCSATGVLLVDGNVRDTHTLETVQAATASNIGGVSSRSEALGRQTTNQSDLDFAGLALSNRPPNGATGTLERENLLVSLIRLMAKGEEERKELERENLRAAELKEADQNLIDDVAHECRTPLSVIKEYSTLIRNGMVGSASEQQRMLQVIGDRSDDLNRMIDEMLDISRLRAGTLHVWRRLHSPAEIVAQIVPSLKTKAELQKLKITFDIPDDLPDIFCDADSICRALTTLAVSAIKGCGVPGQVQVKAHRSWDKRSIRVDITHSAVGIDSAERQPANDRVSWPAHNLNCCGSYDGLGLKVAQQLVEINLGTISVDSTPDGGGTYSFTVPLANVHEIVRRYLDRCTTAEAGSTITLLVATFDDGSDAIGQNEVDALLNYVSLNNEVSVPIGANRWSIIAKADRHEAESLIERCAAARKDANRNRRSAALPALDVRIAGTWQVPQDTAAILETVERLTCEPFFVMHR